MGEALEVCELGDLAGERVEQADIVVPVTLQEEQAVGGVEDAVVLELREGDADDGLAAERSKKQAWSPSVRWPENRPKPSRKSIQRHEWKHGSSKARPRGEAAVAAARQWEQTAAG